MLQKWVNVYFHFCLTFHFVDRTFLFLLLMDFGVVSKAPAHTLGPWQIWIYFQPSRCTEFLSRRCLAPPTFPCGHSKCFCLFSLFPWLAEKGVVATLQFSALYASTIHTQSEHMSCPAGLLKEAKADEAISHHPRSWDLLYGIPISPSHHTSSILSIIGHSPQRPAMFPPSSRMRSGPFLNFSTPPFLLKCFWPQYRFTYPIMNHQVLSLWINDF